MDATDTSDLGLSKNLIKLIKDQPFLYDKTLEEFKDEARKSQAWNEISQSLHLSVEDAQVRWARLRIDFGRHRRKMKDAETSGNRTRSWPLYGLLTWLAPHVKMRASRGQRKQKGIIIKTEPSEYRSNSFHANEMMSSNESVNVKFSPSVIKHEEEEAEEEEEITESFIVSPDTADYEDDASSETFNIYGQQPEKLSEREIKNFLQKYEEMVNFVEDMRGAFRAPSSQHVFSMSSDNTFTWKRRLATGLVAKLGWLKMSQVTPIESYETVLDKSLEVLMTCEERVNKIRTENQSLRKERDTALEKVIEMSELKSQWEKKIYGQFVAVLNAKKERIQALEEMLDLDLNDEPHSKDGKESEDEDEKDEVAQEEQGEEDPYAGDTDVDSDGDATMEAEEHASTSRAPSSSCSARARRSRDVFSLSFDGPDSPVQSPILPKRARASRAATSNTTAASKAAFTNASTNPMTSTASSKSTRASARSTFEAVSEAGDNEGKAVESTQDLISQL